jgi:hypothetical protein
MSALIDIFSCTSKADLEKLCKTRTVTMRELVDLIILCKAGLAPLNHTMHFFDFVPPELETKEEDWKVLRASKEVQASKDGQKAIRRLFKSHGKRQYRVGHMFFSREQSHPISIWHFLFFETNELRTKDNHWAMGPHVHITNHLWPNLYCQSIWDAFIQRKEFPQSKLHLSCIDENRKDT